MPCHRKNFSNFFRENRRTKEIICPLPSGLRKRGPAPLPLVAASSTSLASPYRGKLSLSAAAPFPTKVSLLWGPHIPSAAWPRRFLLLAKPLCHHPGRLHPGRARLGRVAASSTSLASPYRGKLSRSAAAPFPTKAPLLRGPKKSPRACPREKRMLLYSCLRARTLRGVLMEWAGP